jgi:hypothetical protein
MRRFRSRCSDLMKLDIDVVRLQGTLRRLAELRDPGALVVHVDQSLIAVNWTRLRTPDPRAAIVLGPPGTGSVLAAKLAVDDAWTIEPKSQRVLLARDGELSFIDPSHKLPARNLKPDELPPGTFGAVVDSEGKRALLIVVRDVNMDSSEYTVLQADLASGLLTPQPAIHGNAELELLWDGVSRAWVIGDTHTGSLWLWDGQSPAVKFEGPPGDQVHSATFAAATDGVIVTALQEGNRLLSGVLGADRVDWSPPVALSGTSALIARRHLTRPVWACLTYQGAAQQIQILDAAGKVQAAAPVRSPILLNNLQWSTASPNRVWGLGMRALAAATLTESDSAPPITLK